MRYVRPGNQFVPLFDLMNKTDVNGENESVIYTYLKDLCPIPTDATFEVEELFWKPIKPYDISWNFEKFIIDTNGTPRLRFRPKVPPLEIKEILVELTKKTSWKPGSNHFIETRLKAVEEKFSEK